MSTGEHRSRFSYTGTYCVFDGDDWPCKGRLDEIQAASINAQKQKNKTATKQKKPSSAKKALPQWFRFRKITAIPYLEGPYVHLKVTEVSDLTLITCQHCDCRGFHWRVIGLDGYGNEQTWYTKEIEESPTW